MFSLEDVGKVYRSRRGSVAALRDVALRIEPGRFVTVTGPSGSGKTTLLLMLAGLIRPSSGRVLFRGEDLANMSEGDLARFRNRKIGFVLQMFHLIPYLSALENVMVPMLLGRVNGDAGGSRERAAALLCRLGMEDHAELLPRELSVGQQQRVAIARALANGPEVILADEPTGNLDPDLSREVLDVLGALRRERGTTVVMVTHSPEAAARGEQRLRLEAGRCTRVV